MATCELKEDFFISKHVEQSKNHIILQSILHTAQMKEESLWPALMVAFNHWFKLPQEQFDKINKIIRLIQVVNNTIVDAGENAQTRKGEATANSIHGASDALNSTYYCLLLVLEKVRDLNDFEAVKLCNEYNLNSTRAQGIEIYWRDNIICPSEKEYRRIAAYKTGGLVKFTMQLMQLFSKNKTGFGKVAEILGKMIHIYDDYISLFNLNKYFLNKNGLDHISEGRFSFPFVHAIRTHKEDMQLLSKLNYESVFIVSLDILRQKSTIDEVLQYTIRLLKRFGSLEYTLKTLNELRDELIAELDKKETNPFLLEILDQMWTNLKKVDTGSKDDKQGLNGN